MSMSFNERRQAKFVEETVPRILEAVNRDPTRWGPWSRSEDGTWKTPHGKSVLFGSPPRPIDHALKPEFIVAALKKAKGKVFAREGVGWGFCRGGRWIVETWEGTARTFRRKAEAQTWLDELE